MKKTKQTKIDENLFWKQFDGFDPDACWEVKTSLTKAGYGRIWLYPKMIYTHRAAWILKNGQIPKGLCVCHKCDNPPCCNPKHLFLGTHRENMRDSKDKGRNRHGPILYGESHPLSKLTRQDVEEIRATYIPNQRVKNPFGTTALAKKYGVAKSLIHRIVTGQSWPILIAP